MKPMKVLCIAALCALSCCVAAHAVTYDWSSVEATIEKSIANKVFPGAVAAVATADGTVFLKAFGDLTYGKNAPHGPNQPTTVNTRYDLASLTKVTATTTAVAQFYQRGELDLHMPIMDEYLLGPAYGGQGKDIITPLNCMLHNAGYPPDPNPDYWSPEFGCSATNDYYSPETFDCNERIYKGLLAQTLINPVGDKYVYSDLSMITMQFVVGTLAQRLGYITEGDLLPACSGGGLGLNKTCYYEAYVRKHVFGALDMTESGFRPPQAQWPNIAPTWLDDTYRHQTMQGQVSDGNSYALGGVAGHAGVFSTAPNLLILMKKIMFATAGDTYINSTTVDFFTKAYNLTQSSRAIGWDTNSYTMNTYRGCGNFSTLTYTHLGYTGTEVCNDPTRKVITVLLDNRCYPNKTGNLGYNIQHARRDFNNAVLQIVDSAAAAAAAASSTDPAPAAAA